MNIERDGTGDAALEAAWREHSRETSPPHVDQAIVAAAHRAVGSVPQDSVAAGTRPQLWWMPLAAAATIGAIVVGVLQVTPPQELMVAPPVHGSASPSTSARDAAHAAKVGEAGQDTQTSRQTATATPPSVDQRALTREQWKGDRGPKRDADRSVERGARRREVPATDSTAGDEHRTSESDSFARDHAPAVAKSLARRDTAVAPAPAPMLAPPSAAAHAPAPFPTPSSAAARAPAPFPIPPPAAAPAPAPVLAPPPTTSSAAAPTETYAPTPSSPIASAPLRQPIRDPVRDSEALGAAASRAESPLLARSSLTPEEARARASDPDAWIARIRRLRDEGQMVAAVRELAAFRAMVADAERRVPSDLREWAATVAR
ncbi:MAG: hypothetical protein H0T80_15715 [Betaproteobacteria bacterium]|nr:hypothetical protein [Betaproteobacteria bacterium]